VSVKRWHSHDADGNLTSWVEVVLASDYAALRADYSALEAKALASEAKYRSAVEVLRQVEFNGHRNRCPVCDGWEALPGGQGSYANAHSEGCTLKAALSDHAASKGG
jgi:hypothetical protein